MAALSSTSASRAAAAELRGPSWALELPSGLSLATVDVSEAARDVLGVQASLKSASDPSVTLAVFAVPAGDAHGTAAAHHGSARSFAAARAAAAPRQTSLAFRERRAQREVVFEAETAVGGGTAGRFGSAVELVAVVTTATTDFEVRATASGAAWPGASEALRRCVGSFRFTGGFDE